MKILFTTLFSLLLFSSSIFAQNRALDFNGSDEYVNCGTFNLSDSPTDNSFTYECWFKVDAFGGLSNLVGFEVNGSNTALIRINNSKLELVWAEQGYSYYTVTGATTLETNKWYHAAGVFDDNGAGAATAYLFLNGVQDGYATGMMATVSANSTFYIGGSGGRYLDGQMDEVRVWKGVARTQTEVQDNMYTELAGTETGLFAYYKLNETTGTTAYDAQVSGTYDGTLVNCTFDDNSTRGVIIYVDADVTGGDGATWASAYSSLQDALDIAVTGNIIWVAEGTYKPSVEVGGTGTRFQTFQMKNGIEIYGGFAGTETATSQRTDYGNGGANETILSGDIGTVDDNADNCYHVIYNSQSLALNNTAILDGFTITGGNANSLSDITQWVGGGMFNYSSSPTVKNCYFIDNSALDGGALTNYTSSSPKIINCAFVENQSNRYGGGIYNYSNCSPTVTNCTFTNNSANDKGGAIRNFNSSNPVIKNSIFWSNSAINGENEISNVITSVPVISYSNIEGSGGSTSWDTNLGTDGENNIDANPLFAGSQNTSHPYSLTGISPCLDVGDNSVDQETYDIRGAGFGRNLDKTNGDVSTTDIDMGAYEYKFGSDAAGVTFFVSETGSNSDGKSWTNAYTSFQSALDAAVSGCEIWVAKGTYIPSYDYGLNIAAPNTERGYHFRMINGVEIYGGFAGTETATSQRTNYRDGGDNETILSGDIGTVDDNSDNCYHVFYHNADGLDNTAILDGFTITKGNASTDTYPYRDGGGMILLTASPTIRNCVFKDNNSNYAGGAIYIRTITAQSTIISNSIFSNNTSSAGGAIFLTDANITIANSTFNNNTADQGGAFFSTKSEQTIVNCLFHSNSSTVTTVTDPGGGALYISGDPSTATIDNCTFSANSTTAMGGAVLNNGVTPIYKNSIFWGNTAVGSGNEIYNNYGGSATFTNCDISGSGGSSSWDTNLGTDDGNNIDSNPLFAGSQNASHPYSLTGASPCADVGDDAANSESYDIRGSDFGRKLSKIDGTVGTIDMGAYEYKFGTDPESFTFFVKETTGGANDGSSWADAFNTSTAFQDALDAAVAGCEIWVAKGTYKPSSAYLLTNTSRYYHFEMKNGVEIYGGFAGTETATSQRTDYGVGGTNETKLSGYVDGTNDCYHVFYNPDGLALDNTAILDGFTITAGYANSTTPHSSGGGMYNSGSSPTINNCSFNNNSGSYGGGALFIQNASPSYSNCSFNSNSSGDEGGAIFMRYSSNPTFTNCIITDNTSAGHGGGVSIKGISTKIPNPSFVNCTFTNNSVTTDGNNLGGGIYAGSNTNFTLSNSIVWGNSTAAVGDNDNIRSDGDGTIYYSNIGGSGGSSSWGNYIGNDGGDNIDADPSFYDSDNGDYRITQTSPCVEAGDDAANTDTTDIRGSGRKLLSTDYTQVGTIDMGAYEYNSNLDPASPTPVELVSFTAELRQSSATEMSVLLKWETATEINNYGFEVERASIRSKERNYSATEIAIEWEVLGFIQGHGNSNSPKYYEFLDETPLADSAEYRLKQIDTDGKFAYYHETVKVNGYGVTDVEDIDIPKEYALEQNYPNPFNPSTTIKYSIPVDTRRGVSPHVTLKVYNIIGQEVATLVNKVQQPGNYSVNFDASNLSSGAYIYKITASEFVSVKKLILMK